MDAERKMTATSFFATHPVFSLEEVEKAFSHRRGRTGTVERLRHHLRTGRLKLVSRGVYAVIPHGVLTELFEPDPFLVAVAVRPDGVFSHHSALELLGTAQSVWSTCTLFTGKRRKPFIAKTYVIRFLDLPGPLSSEHRRMTGTRKSERRGRIIHFTGPERTLVEGFRRPGLVGGLEELVRSATGFPTLDLSLLGEILRCYDMANLWSAVGWFLERYQSSFQVPESFVEQIFQHRARSPQYLDRGTRGGAFVQRWNLILPNVLEQRGEQNEP